MKLEQIPAPDFDLAATLESGQVFHWEKFRTGFAGMIDDQPVYIEQRGRKLFSYGGNRRLIERYFSLDHPLSEICASFPPDPVMNAAQQFCRGLRIIRQPRWECLATFITSSMKQVAHIRQISEKLRERYGQVHRLPGLEMHSFPSAKRIAQLSESELKACALGYRAKNLLATARQVSSSQADLEAWSALPDEALLNRLRLLPGVGPKVANCVLLFAYERLRAFPIDVWIERVLVEKYFAGRGKPGSRVLRDFAGDYFGIHGGYAQQYLYHHARKTRGTRSKSKTI